MSSVRSPAKRGPWSLADTYDFISIFLSTSGGRILSPQAAPTSTQHRQAYSHIAHRHGLRSPRARSCPRPAADLQAPSSQTRHFHDYFVTNLPSSSLHPDSRSATGPHHKLPRAASTPHTPKSPDARAAAAFGPSSRDLTVVRIPLKSAKHHFGVSISRGQRPYNEDSFQAGTIEIPAFAKRAPISLSRRGAGPGPGLVGGGTSADSASGDPQVFYFAVFDGHGGSECSEFLKDELHGYIEKSAEEFELGSSLKRRKSGDNERDGRSTEDGGRGSELAALGKERLEGIEIGEKREVEGEMVVPEKGIDGRIRIPDERPALESQGPGSGEANTSKALALETSLVAEWKDTVGGYFRRFRPEYFSLSSSMGETPVSIETVLMYSFLKADLDFVTAQARKPDHLDDHATDKPLNEGDVLGQPAYRMPPPSKNQIGGAKRFIGGSTASVVLISTPNPTPFWHPASPCTMVVAHVGDTRILLCETATGLAKPLTTNHHPSAPVESRRLRRYAATFVTDSFGEERMSGLANTRAFGDMRSKRIGVSAEPELLRIELAPAEYSFIVLVSDGVSGSASDQEIVDVVKEAKTPEQGARDVVSYAEMVSKDGDNATCLVVRLGGWERRGEGGMGSMGTKEVRDFRKGDAEDPRRGRR